MRRKFLFAAALCLPWRFVGAATATADGDYFSDLPVILSASRLVQSVDEAPAAVTILDRDTIRASGARGIVELFRLAPGFQVGYQNGHEPTVTYHGLGDAYARRLQVMIDGVSVYSPIYGGVEWNLLPIGIDDIERIEIVRGPNGASYGANAFTGMVNIITRESIAGARTTLGSLNTGSNGIADWGMQHSSGRDDWRYRLSAGQRSDRGFDSLADDSRAQYLRAQGHYRLDTANELMGAFSYSSGHGQEQPNLTSQIRPRQIEDADVQLRWTRATAADELWLQFHHGQRHATEDIAFVLNTQAIPPLLPALQIPMRLNFKFETQRDELEFQRTMSGEGGWRWLWGGQWRQDRVRSQTFFDRPDWLSNSLARLFGSAEWRPLPALLLHAGATYERPSLGDSSVSPRVSATIHLAEGHSLRAGISQARRNPVPFEESVNWGYPVPGPLRDAIAAIPAHLRPLVPPPWNTRLFQPVYSQQFLNMDTLSGERILSRELAYLGRWPAARLGGELRWFDDRVSNLIHVDNAVPFPTVEQETTRAYRQGDTAAQRGLEGSLKWSPWHGTDLRVAAARIKTSSSGGGAESYYERTAPANSASALLRQQLPGQILASIGYYRVGAMRWLSGGDPVPGYERVDLRLAKSLLLGPHRIDVAWVVQNLNGSRYQDFYSYLANKRSAWLNIRYEY